MSSRGLLGALLGVAGELTPSVEESLPSVFKRCNKDCNYMAIVVRLWVYLTLLYSTMSLLDSTTPYGHSGATF